MEEYLSSNSKKVEYGFDEYLNGDLKKGKSPGRIDLKDSSKSERVVHILKWIAYSNRDGGEGVINYEEAFSNVNNSLNAMSKIGGQGFDYFDRHNPINIFINGNVYSLSISTSMWYNIKGQLVGKTVSSHFGSDGSRSNGWTYTKNLDLRIGTPSRDFYDILKYIYNSK